MHGPCNIQFNNSTDMVSYSRTVWLHTIVRPNFNPSVFKDRSNIVLYVCYIGGCNVILCIFRLNVRFEGWHSAWMNDNWIKDICKFYTHIL
jgi:hypothetical protein